MKVTLCICKMTFPSSLFHPAPLPSSTPGHESENPTPRKARRRASRERIERQIRRDGRAGSISIRSTELETIWPGSAFLTYKIQYSTRRLHSSMSRWCRSPFSPRFNRPTSAAQCPLFGSRLLLFQALLRLSRQSGWHVARHKTLPWAETTYYIRSTTSWAQTQK